MPRRQSTQELSETILGEINRIAGNLNGKISSIVLIEEKTGNSQDGSFTIKYNYTRPKASKRTTGRGITLVSNPFSGHLSQRGWQYIEENSPYPISRIQEEGGN